MLFVILGWLQQKMKYKIINNFVRCQYIRVVDGSMILLLPPKIHAIAHKKTYHLVFGGRF